MIEELVSRVFAIGALYSTTYYKLKFLE